MKKVCCTLLSVLLAFSIVGCGGKPSDLDEGTYQDAIAVINITDQYLNGEIDIEELDEKLEEFENSFDISADGTSGDVAMDFSLLNIGVGNAALGNRIDENSEVLGESSSGGKDYRSEIRENRNSLAKTINYKE